MLCKVCRDGLEGVYDPSRTKRICLADDWTQKETHLESIPSIGVYITETVRSSPLSEPEKYIYGHHLTQESFQQSLAEGCVMCTRFRPWPGRDDKPEDADPKLAAVGYYSVFSLRLDPPMMGMRIRDSQGGFRMVPHDPDDEDMNCKISSSTADDATWQLIQKWYDKCTESHDSCISRPDSKFLPPRLVVFDTATKEETEFRVIEGTSVTAGTPYITLSHCWDVGSDPPSLTFTDSNASKLSAPQPVSLLPKALQDAFAVMTRLNVSHIWVDFLCTIQDSPSDKAAESANKQAIFTNAALNLSALGAANPNQGLFATRNPDKVNPTVVKLPFSSADDVRPHRFDLEKGWAWRNYFSDEPLVKSAKNMVERLFARRTLHFGSRMVFWECCEANCAEVHPRGVYGLSSLGSHTPRDNQKHLWKQLLDAPDDRDVKDPLGQLFTDWYAIIMLYTSCKLSSPSQKLLGLSDVARAMKSRLEELHCEDSTYLAGIWKHRLPHSLIWNLRGHGTRPAEYRAPSWSWAAIDGHVNPHDWIQGSHELVASVLKAEVVSGGQDDLGKVVGGSVVLKGRPAMAKLYRPESTDLSRSEGMLVKCLVNPGNEEQVTEVPPPPGKAKYNAFWSVSFDTKEAMCDTVLVLPIRMNPWAQSTNIHGLALSQVDADKYVRVGHLSLTVGSEDDARGIVQSFPEKQIEII